jgi:hypothetical protein
MAKKTLLSENQIANFMKLANIRTEKAQNFKNRILKENMGGFGGTGGMDEMEEDEPSAAEQMGGEMEMAAEAEPEQPTGGTIEKESDELMDMIKNAVKDALAEAGLGEEEGMEGMDMESEEEMPEEEMPEEEMEEEGEEEEEEEEEEGEMEEYELQEAKKKAAKKAHNLKGGDAKKMKESLAFDNVDLVTDDEIINEVLKRVIRRIV